MSKELGPAKGRVAICSKGIPGVIEGQKELPWGLAWVGRKVKDGGPWSSRHPRVVADSLAEYLAENTDNLDQWYEDTRASREQWLKDNP